MFLYINNEWVFRLWYFVLKSEIILRIVDKKELNKFVILVFFEIWFYGFIELLL